VGWGEFALGAVFALVALDGVVLVAGAGLAAGVAFYGLSDQAGEAGGRAYLVSSLDFYVLDFC
jgi:hypothetical protein